MPTVLVSPVKGVMFIYKTEFEHPSRQCVVARPCAALTAVGLEILCHHPKRHAGLAIVTVGSIGKHPTAAKALANQLRIRRVVNEMTRLNGLNE
jgi:hypothetical protein